MRLSLVAALWLAAFAPASAQGIGTGLGPLDATGRAALDTGVDLLAATLANALRSSQDQARQAGTLPIPPQIRAALLTWYPAELLQGIEYRVGIGQDPTLQSWSIRYGDAVAVTTIDTITFANAFDATNNVALWAHEVKHVEQFRRWGVMDFARRYVRDHRAVEREALAAAGAFRTAYDAGAWRGTRATGASASASDTALVCATPEGACVMGIPLAPGQSCSCPSDRGRVPGLSQ